MLSTILYEPSIAMKVVSLTPRFSGLYQPPKAKNLFSGLWRPVETAKAGQPLHQQRMTPSSREIFFQDNGDLFIQPLVAEFHQRGQRLEELIVIPVGLEGLPFLIGFVHGGILVLRTWNV